MGAGSGVGGEPLRLDGELGGEQSPQAPTQGVAGFWGGEGTPQTCRRGDREPRRWVGWRRR